MQPGKGFKKKGFGTGEEEEEQIIINHLSNKRKTYHIERFDFIFKDWDKMISQFTKKYRND